MTPGPNKQSAPVFSKIVAPTPINKVKTKDVFRSQVFSTKSAKPATLLANKNVDREEALAGIALLSKHEQAMKRYEGATNKVASANDSSADYYAKKKPTWNGSTNSPTAGRTSPYVSLLGEPDGYQLIQLKQTSFASNTPDTLKEVPEPFHAS